MARKKIEAVKNGDSLLIDMSTGKAAEAGIPLICRQIRHYRELRGIEQKAFARQIGVTGNAVSNWERGRARPDLNLLPVICGTLNITLYELFGEEKPAEAFSQREKQLVKGYRALTPGNQYAVDKLVETLGFVQSAEQGPALCKLLYFERGLAAGAADPTEFEQEAEPIYLHASPEAGRADYVFPVNGDSMEPAYHSGDLVLVQKVSEAVPLRYGEIGAFIVGNETYIKQYEKDGLHSLNTKYAPLRFDEEQAVYLIGRVLGIAAPEAVATSTEVSTWLALHGSAQPSAE